MISCSETSVNHILQTCAIGNQHMPYANHKLIQTTYTHFQLYNTVSTNVRTTRKVADTHDG
jgi:carbohydrate-binding DOMON domain-containing protein